MKYRVRSLLLIESLEMRRDHNTAQHANPAVLGFAERSPTHSLHIDYAIVSTQGSLVFERPRSKLFPLSRGCHSARILRSLVLRTRLARSRAA
ncbi:hypothetical protein F5Y18DRAFT_373820 [Xylariaceae sp. FL1019]|nr:hypothetical protein F5Y18DRAFT_373820 [Xylariaceae sp. FL1019]